MIVPKTNSDLMMFMTVFIRGEDRDGIPTFGTGFLFDFGTESPDIIRPAIITNKHVISDMVKGTFEIHAIDPTPPKNPLPSSIEFGADNFCNAWTMHPNPAIDLCAAPIGVFSAPAGKGVDDIYRCSVMEDLIPSEVELSEMRAVENVLMVGYPSALWDHVNNFPLIRRGITASHPAIDFQGRPDGVVDLASFAGSSGSPLFIVDEGAVPVQGGWTMGVRFRFLGVMYGQYTINSNNQIKLSPIPVNKRQHTRVGSSVHLGCYHKAREVTALAREIDRIAALARAEGKKTTR